MTGQNSLLWRFATPKRGYTALLSGVSRPRGTSLNSVQRKQDAPTASGRNVSVCPWVLFSSGVSGTPPTSTDEAEREPVEIAWEMLGADPMEGSLGSPVLPAAIAL